MGKSKELFQEKQEELYWRKQQAGQLAVPQEKLDSMLKAGTQQATPKLSDILGMANFYKDIETFSTWKTIRTLTSEQVVTERARVNQQIISKIKNYYWL